MAEVLRGIVSDLAATGRMCMDVEGNLYCIFCEAYPEEPHNEPHAPECVWLRARQITNQ